MRAVAKSEVNWSFMFGDVKTADGLRERRRRKRLLLLLLMDVRWWV